HPTLPSPDALSRVGLSPRERRMHEPPLPPGAGQGFGHYAAISALCRAVPSASLQRSRTPSRKMRSLRVVQMPNPTRIDCMRVFNFSAGPAVLPEAVLQQAAAEMLDWHGSGMSVMEMTHRGKEFIPRADTAAADLRTLLAIPAS